MTEKKSSRYANISCVLFVLLALYHVIQVFLYVPVLHRWIDYYPVYTGDLIDVIYNLIMFIICLFACFLLKKLKNRWSILAVVLSLFFILKFYPEYPLFEDVFKWFGIMESNLLGISLLLSIVACLIFISVSFSFKKMTAERIMTCTIVSLALNLLGIISFVVYMIYDEEFSLMIINEIIICAVFVSVGMYFKSLMTPETESTIQYIDAGSKNNETHDEIVIGSAEKIKEYKDMLDSGIITQDEFEQIKSQLLQS